MQMVSHIIIVLYSQYLRQKMKECRAFEVELLSPKTNDSTDPKAHERYCSTVTLSDPVSVEYNDAAVEANRLRRTVYPGSRDDVEHRALDRARGQLSNDPTLVSYTDRLGSDVVDYRSNAFARSKGRVSVGRRRSGD